MDLADHGAPAPTRPNEAMIRRWLIDHVARTAGLAIADVDPSAPFNSFGIDSLAAAELLAELELALGEELDPTIVFSYESPSALAAFLAGRAERNEPVTTRHRTTGSPNGGAAASEGGAQEPVAVVGIGCRFPGAHGPEDYWRLLTDAVDAVGPVPDGRWEAGDLPDDLPTQLNLGGFVDGIDRFDPAFFGISQLEADRMDPQQRMLLEVAWEAFEDGGVPPSSLRGTPTGVFLGISSPEYGRRQGEAPELIDVFFGTGNALSIAANRVSYGLDLRGPSLAVDTACSSSLVAIHLACAAIRRGECTAALAGGANAILTPLLTLNFIKAGAIAADGRCKAFDASADGIVRGEGAGLVWLKPLSAALADDDRIYCVIEGSATNSDGRSNGLTAPNPEAQIEVFAAACADAGVDAGSVGYVEAHGTGTVLGDAMELSSLDEVYGDGRDGDAPLLVGSVKTNIGHLESAAGIAGVIKAALAIHHRSIPPSLHYETPNLFLERTDALAVVDTLTPWPEGGPARAAISGFGFGGTNAHVIIGPAPQPTAVAPAVVEDGPIVLAMSARSPAALAATVERIGRLVAEDPSATRSLAIAQALTRDDHPRRLAIVAEDTSAVTDALAAAAAGTAHRCAIAGDRRSGEPGRVAFVFSGQGRAWWPFDPQLLADPVIASVLERCDAEMSELAGFSILEVLRSGEPVLDHERAQPLLYSLQVALAERWRAFGVEPDLLIGQSIGEVAAAHIGGAIPLADGLEIVLNRGRFMEESNGTGHTAFVELAAEDVAAIIEDLDADVAIAGITAPNNTLISGPKDDTVAVVAAATARGVMAQVFTVGDIPGHGPMMTPYADKLSASIDFLEPRRGRVPIISTVTGGLIDGTELDAAYWGRNLRRTVRFTDAMASAVDAGAELFIEIAAHPVVEVSARRCLEALGSPGTVMHTIKQGEPGSLALRRSLAAAWTRGATVDWRAVTGHSTATVAAPRYPWDHRRCWFERPDGDRPPRRGRTERGPRWHPLLEDRVDVSDRSGTHTWAAMIGPDAPTAAGRRVGGLQPTPGLALELAAAATASILTEGDGVGGGVALVDVELAPPQPVDGGATLHLSATPRSRGCEWQLTMSDGERTTPLARGAAEPVSDPGAIRAVPPSRLALTGERHEGAELLEVPALRSASAGALGCLRSVVTSEDRAVAALRVPGADVDPTWIVDPGLIDAALATAIAVGPAGSAGAAPVALDRLVVRRPPGPEARAVIGPASGTDTGTGTDVELVDEWGAVTVAISGIGVAARATGRGSGGETLPGALLIERWTDEGRVWPTVEADPDRRWFCLGEANDELFDRLRHRLGADHGGEHELTAWLDAQAGGQSAVVIVDRPTRSAADTGGDAEASVLDVDGVFNTVGRVAEAGAPAPRVYLVTRAGRPNLDAPVDPGAAVLAGSLSELVVAHPEVRPTSIDVGGIADLEGLAAELCADAPDDAVLIRGERRSVGQLEEVPVPPARRVRRGARGRPWRAVWNDRTVDTVPSGPPEPGPGEVVVEVTAAITGTAEPAAAFPGRGVGVAAIGRVVAAGPTSADDGPAPGPVPDRPAPGDRAPATAGVAVVAPGAVTSHLVVDRAALWPLPDRTDGVDGGSAALSALARLDAWHGDLLAARRRDPGLLRATYTRLAGDGEAHLVPGPIEELHGATPSHPTAVVVEHADPELTELVDAWAADASATYLVGTDGVDERARAARRFAVDWLLERGAARLVVVGPGDAPTADRPTPGIELVHSPAIDVSDPAVLDRLIGGAGTVQAPLAGLIWFPDHPATADRLDRASQDSGLSLFVTIAPAPASDRPAPTIQAAPAAVARRRCAAGRRSLHLALGPGGGWDERPGADRLVGRVLDRLLAAEMPAAAFDERGWSEVVAGVAAVRPWLAALAPRVDTGADTSLAGRLATTAPGARRALIADIVGADIASILGIDPDDLDADTPVDAYGVDSLVGMELRTRIETGFDYTVPLTELSRTMTTNALADHLLAEAVPPLLAGAGPALRGGTGSAETSRVAATAVPVRTGTGPMTWWVPGMFGTPETFTELGAALGDRPVDEWAMWAFGAPGLDGSGRGPLASVPQLADEYLEVLRSRQPEGPYLIGGYSLGALVAFEITARLEAVGDRVDHLWLLDPPPPVDAPEQDRSGRVRSLFADHLNELFFGPTATGDPLDTNELVDLNGGSGLDTVVARVRRDGVTSLDEPRLRALLNSLRDLAVASTEAMAGYRPSAVVRAPSTLVHTTQGPTVDSRRGSPGIEWFAHLALPPATATIETDHARLLREPHAAAVAAVITRSVHLDRQRRPPEAPETTNVTTTTAPTTTAEHTAAPSPRTGGPARAALRRLAHSPRLRDAVGAAGNLYRQGDFLLRALGGERRFRRHCIAGEGLIVGDRGQIANLSGDPGRIRLGHHCLIDGFLNVQEYAYLSIGSYCGIGVDARIDCAGYVEIGNGCTLAEGVYIIDGLHHPLLVNQRIEHGIDLFQGSHVMDAYGPGTETSFVRIEDLVWIGLRAVVLSGVTIGRGSVIAAGAVISQDVPPYSVVAGNPGRVIGQIPADDFDIESHPTYRSHRGDERLPDSRRDPRAVLEEIARKVAARPG